MFNKFKSALYNVVGNFDPAEGSNSVSPASALKFPYTRPHFLQLNSEDEIQVTADHGLRPIICPRDISKLPWNTGYAETINAGKSRRNEDQAAVHVGVLTRIVGPSSASVSNGLPVHNGVDSLLYNAEAEVDPADGLRLAFNSSESDNSVSSSAEAVSPSLKRFCTLSTSYYYFGVFDGHAGWGAAVSAANQLHHFIHEKLLDVVELILPDEDPSNGKEQNSDDEERGFWPKDQSVSPEDAVIGALEQAFWAMDQQIGNERLHGGVSGGCTACVALFILGRVFVANAGDSRATMVRRAKPTAMSFDFTPETETGRIRKLGARHPELLGNEFTHLEYLRRPLRSDVGRKAAFRDHYMRGWALKTITEADLKYPLVCGHGKRSRVLATIGVTRGFGDHDLKAQFSALPIKPFLSPEPEVRVLNLCTANVSDSDVLILGTDGLWDIVSNAKAAYLVSESLLHFSPKDTNKYKYRYTSAAHDLVLWSRGRLREHSWRTSEDRYATIDDISVFVIPLRPYRVQFYGDSNSERLIPKENDSNAVGSTNQEIFEESVCVKDVLKKTDKKVAKEEDKQRVVADGETSESAINHKPHSDDGSLVIESSNTHTKTILSQGESIQSGEHSSNETPVDHSVISERIAETDDSETAVLSPISLDNDGVCEELENNEVSSSNVELDSNTLPPDETKDFESCDSEHLK